MGFRFSDFPNKTNPLTEAKRLLATPGFIPPLLAFVTSIAVTNVVGAFMDLVGRRGDCWGDCPDGIIWDETATRVYGNMMKYESKIQSCFASLTFIPIILIYIYICSSAFNSWADSLTPASTNRNTCAEAATSWLQWPDGSRLGRCRLWSGHCVTRRKVAKDCERRRCWATAEFSFELLVSLCHDISWYITIFWYGESNGDMLKLITCHKLTYMS